jgi:PAT family beta-lactamase induction signal transducer AmpG
VERPTPPVLSRGRLLGLVGALYFAQGMPAGVVTELIPVWLKDRGTSLQDIGLASLIGLPWTLKPLWAPLVDRYGSAGRWVGGALFTIAALLLLLPQVADRPALLWPLLVGIVLASATQDIAIDGFTATVAPPAEHGRVNGVRVAAYRGALLVAGGGAVALGGSLPWAVVFALLGGLALLLALPTLLLPVIPRARVGWGDFAGGLWAWASRDGAARGLGLVAFLVLFKLGDAAMGPMVKPFWMDVGLGVEEIGFISITLGAALTVGGAMAGGELVSRLGLFRGLWMLGLAQGASNLGYAVVALEPSRAGVYFASVVESFSSGLGTAAFLATLTRLCDGEQAATRFALLTALGMIARTIAGAVSGYGAAGWGYPTWFAFTFVLSLPAFLLLPVVRERLRGSGDGTQV